MTNKMFSKVFLWMFVGLLITFGTAYIISINENIMYNLFSGNKFWIIWIAELVVVMVLSVRIRKLNTMTAKLLFILYSALTGVSISSIFIVYSIDSIVYVFLLAAFLFLIFGLIGMFTKLDVSKLGTILLMILLGCLICTVVNIFLNNDTFDFALSIIFIIVFLGYTAYDINVIKKNYYNIEDEDKLAIYGALQLYLDFINIFLQLLKFFGKKND